MISQQCNYIALYLNHQYFKVHYFLKSIFCDNFAIKGAQRFRIFPHSSFVKIKYIALRLVKRENTKITAPSSSLKALLQRSPLQQCKVHSINTKPLQVSRLEHLLLVSQPLAKTSPLPLAYNFAQLSRLGAQIPFVRFFAQFSHET